MASPEQQPEQLAKSLERERTLARIVDRIRRTLNPDQIFATTVEELRHNLECDRVVIYRFNADYTGQFVAESVSAGWLSLLSQQQAGKDSFSETINQDRCFVKKLQSSANEPVIDTYLHETQGGRYRQGTRYTCVADIYQPGFDECYVRLLEQFQARAYIMAAIFQGDVLWGLLGIYQNSTPRHWQPEEVNIAVQVGDQMAIAIQQSELLAQVQQTSQELKHAMQAVQAANQAKTDFLANMSHELRTPLNVILGATQVMNRDTTLSPVQKDNLQTILRNGEHLLSLINQVLDLSKIESGYITLEESTVDVFELVNTVHAMMQSRAYSKGLQFSVAIAADVPPYFVTDAKKLRQVLINLVGNAIKFTQQGSIKLQVSVVANPPSPMLCFEVEDSGIGISPENQALIFEAFEQTEVGRMVSGGTGLGLTISREFVELMGGKISLQSTVAQGTIFTTLIPLQLADAVTMPVSNQDCHILGLAPNQPARRILVVDDISDSRKVLTQLLSTIGFEVEEAADGHDAIAKWETWQPHLILMDIRMPILNGREATHQIRQREQTRDANGLKSAARTKIIAFTASAFIDDREQAIAAGYDDFISKPVSETHLLNSIAQHLNITYQYDLIKENGNLDQPEQSLLNLLSQMPQDWLKQLHDAANLCDDTGIEQLLKTSDAPSPVLIQLLENHIRNFNFEPLLEATQQALEALAIEEVSKP